MINNISKRGNDYYITFWASSIYAMNDPSEFNYGYNLLTGSILPDIEKELKIENDALKLSKIWNQISDVNPTDWYRKLKEAIYESHQCPFIVSFSKKKDDLPMWNTYSERGKGVCLCFCDYDWNYQHNDLKLIHRLHASEVSYGGVDDSVKKVIYKIYSNCYNQYRIISDRNQRVCKMTKDLAALAVIASPYHKHEAYSYEDETRLIKFKDENHEVKYRTSKQGNIIPYIEVHTRLDYLNQVIVGPCCDSVAIIRELKSMLKKYGISNIETSKIPYREY